MTHVKKQHIVPEFLLKNFSNSDSHIWSFDKLAIKERWNNQKNRAISSTPTEEYFYDKVIGEKMNSYEYVLRDLETKSAPIITDLIQKRNIQRLSDLDRDVISEFLSIQMLRTKKQLKNSEDFLTKLFMPIEELTGQAIEINNRAFWLGLLETATDYKKHLLNKTWILAESNDEFYLSDNPVVLQNTTTVNNENRGNLGLESKGIEIYLPLSSSVVLGLFCNKTVTKEIPNIWCGSETIENLNWLQISNSDRFLFSKNNNFDLINKMIEENAPLGYDD